MGTSRFDVWYVASGRRADSLAGRVLRLVVLDGVMELRFCGPASVSAAFALESGCELTATF